MIRFPMTQAQVIIGTLLLTAIVYWDSHKHKVSYRNLWVLATFFFTPVFLAYFILRFISSHKVELSKREKMEMLKRQEFEKHSKEVRAERRALEKAAALRCLGKTPEELAQEQEADIKRQDAERKKLRENLDYHAAKRAEKLKIRKKQ
ncbi:MAG: hypothetical protein LKJ99_01575 [Acidaminococcaceae bacterium]|nr:hypothetical protein [Acidaminococcaceae bacterium]MCI2109647.1 hypothetical protein [Acidaminococcaceae bacterium]